MNTVATQQALLLDLDGVLLDTRPVMREAWSAVQRHHGITVPFEDYERYLGRPFDDIMERLGLTDTRLIHQTYSAASKAASFLGRPFEGMDEVLHAFVEAGWLLGVVTSKPLDRAAPLLAQLGCPFGTVRTAGGTARGKPAPDTLLLALVDFGVDPAQAVFVGDMDVDHEASRRAGVEYVHAAWGYGSPGDPLEQVARTPEDLLRLLATGRQPSRVTQGELP